MDSSLCIDGVPECDCGGSECEAPRRVALLLEAAVPDLTEVAEVDRSGEGVASLSFVEAGVNATAEIDALQLRKDEQGSLDAAQLAECNRETVLARIASDAGS
jgi:hypothetical protein